ncbi:efflux RND transporter permease subunit, partial [bacterium]|nr:efflux RND transporter permease subunit [bacterium]
HPHVASVFSHVGLAGDQTTLLLEESDLNRARLHVKLKENAPKSTPDVIADLKEPVNRVGGGNITFESSASLITQFLGTTESDVAIKISGNNLELSKVLLQEVRTKVKTVRGLTDLQSSYEEGRPEIRVSVDRESAARYGLSVRQIAQFVQNRMYGSVSTQFKDFDRKIDILVRPNVEARNELNDLLDSYIYSDKSSVPLRRLIHTEPTQGPTEIRRENQVRQVSLFGNVQGRGFSDVVKEIEERLTQIKRPLDYQILVGGQREEMSRSFRSLTLAFLLAAALVYMILAAQFESLMQPFVISFAVPLAAIGVVVALFVTGQSFNVMSLIGVVVLVGIVVNDAIIKVDFINQERRRGTSLFDAIMEAGKKRLRPILMTTVTTVLALLPMA